MGCLLMQRFAPIRGPGAAIVDNMEASLRIPTATSVRTFPVKLLAENRTLLNQYQRGIDGFKVSFTHIIAYGIVQALKVFPTMFSTFVREGRKPKHVRPSQVNFGLAIDIERRGRRLPARTKYQGGRPDEFCAVSWRLQ